MTSPLRISATLYTTWKTCPTQAAGRLDGHYPADTIASFKGVLAHRIFAHHLTKGTIAPTGFDRICRAEIGSSNLNYKVRDLGLKPSQVRATIAEVAHLYERFKQVAKPATRTDHYTSVELHLEAPIDADTTLIGTIDAIHSSGTLIDWKTGELGHVDDQLDFYMLLWVLAGNPPPTGARAVSLGTGEVYDRAYTPTILTEMSAQIAQLIVDLAGAGHTTRPGPWCRWCPLLDTCTPGSQAMSLLTTTTPTR